MLYWLARLWTMTSYQLETIESVGRGKMDGKVKREKNEGYFCLKRQRVKELLVSFPFQLFYIINWGETWRDSLLTVIQTIFFTLIV